MRQHQILEGIRWIPSDTSGGVLGRGLTQVISVNDDDAGELLVMVTEVLTGALLRLVGPDELERQVTAWLDERRTRLAG